MAKIRSISLNVVTLYYISIHHYWRIRIGHTDPDKAKVFVLIRMPNPLPKSFHTDLRVRVERSVCSLLNSLISWRRLSNSWDSSSSNAELTDAEQLPTDGMLLPTAGTLLLLTAGKLLLPGGGWLAAEAVASNCLMYSACRFNRSFSSLHKVSWFIEKFWIVTFCYKSPNVYIPMSAMTNGPSLLLHVFHPPPHPAHPTSVLWIRIHWFRIRIRIQGFDDQKLEKITAEIFSFLF